MNSPGPLQIRSIFTDYSERGLSGMVPNMDVIINVLVVVENQIEMTFKLQFLCICTEYLDIYTFNITVIVRKYMNV